MAAQCRGRGKAGPGALMALFSGSGAINNNATSGSASTARSTTGTSKSLYGKASGDGASDSNDSGSKSDYDYTKLRSEFLIATRLRIGWCQLNSTLAKFNLTGRGCACGATSETVTHFLLHCPLHAAARQDLATAVYRLVRRPLSTSVLLNGSPGNDITLNESLSHSFHTYITSTNRF
ncbi:hypothetical protein Bbelb_048790 [Branchiostoma belcheri]|nr:hypothetical protein Bbelb_048790 [Branchiostoma belcheri]